MDEMPNPVSLATDLFSRGICRNHAAEPKKMSKCCAASVTAWSTLPAGTRRSKRHTRRSRICGEHRSWRHSC